MYEVNKDRGEFIKVGRETVCRVDFTINLPDGLYCGRFYGTSKCHPDDKYDKEFGKSIAKLRANRRACKVVEKRLLEETHRPEWRKKTDFEIAAENLCEVIQKCFVDLSKYFKETDDQIFKQKNSSR
jgi:hypothetical protein